MTPSRKSDFTAWERRVATIADEAVAELRSATAKFGPMASPHEAYAVVLEELDEFWSAVKTKGVTPAEARVELIQVAAMAMRAVLDCYEGAPPTGNPTIVTVDQ